MVNEKHVFISHSAQDDALGRRIVATLEAQGIKCWYSSRPVDLEPGVDWDENIVSALDASSALVLIFSSASNTSKWVRRELAMATARAVPIYPLRAANVRPTGGMEPYLISVQWLDIHGPGHLAEKLTPLVRRLLAEGNAARPSENRASSSKTGYASTNPPVQSLRKFIRDRPLFQLGSAMIGSFASPLIIQAIPYIFAVLWRKRHHSPSRSVLPAWLPGFDHDLIERMQDFREAYLEAARKRVVRTYRCQMRVKPRSLPRFIAVSTRLHNSVTFDCSVVNLCYTLKSYENLSARTSSSEW
jgi:TIR domain-containing protein